MSHDGLHNSSPEALACPKPCCCDTCDTAISGNFIAYRRVNLCTAIGVQTRLDACMCNLVQAAQGEAESRIQDLTTQLEDAKAAALQTGTHHLLTCYSSELPDR